jgi:hypothetical protein
MDSSNTFSTDDSSQVMGSVYAPDYFAPAASELTTAVGDMETAYNDAAGRANSGAAYLNLGEDSGDIGGRTLRPGVYTFDRDVLITDHVTFAGTSTDVFIIQTSKSVKQALSTNVYLEGGALGENIFWQVAQEVKVGAGAHMEGVLLVQTAVMFISGSSLNGRILAQTACVLQSATITQKP